MGSGACWNAVNGRTLCRTEQSSWTESTKCGGKSDGRGDYRLKRGRRSTEEHRFIFMNQLAHYNYSAFAA
jgi:hypothetical protein